MARCIQIVEPYAANGAIREAARALGRLTKKFNDHTIVRKLCSVCNKYYGKASQAAFDFCTKVLVTLRIALTYSDIRNESSLTSEFLVGNQMKSPGFVHVFFIKGQFVELLKAMVSHSNELYANEIRDNVVFPSSCALMVWRLRLCAAARPLAHRPPRSIQRPSMTMMTIPNTMPRLLRGA